MTQISDLSSPSLLLAMPQIQDPFFYRSVVLLLAHEDAGSFGLVINRPSNLTVREILEDLDLQWRGDPQALAFVGGPVQPQRGTVLIPSAGTLQADATEIAPGVAISQSLTCLSHQAAAPPAQLRLVLGYAGWSAGQLESEILRNDWLVGPVDAATVFQPPGGAWERALLAVGIDPAALPNWTAHSSRAN
jgi:putative transcriptional regulator